MTLTIRMLAATAAACLGAAVLPVQAQNNPPSCVDCGTVIDVKTIEQKGESSGGGAVLGGIVGGVIGHQIGSGRGNTAATVVGAAGGAYAGNQVEKNKNNKVTYQVAVKLDAGNTRYFNFSQPTSYRIGDKIKIVDKKLVRQ
jgi:outer membrane lipoprotein SlyB